MHTSQLCHLDVRPDNILLSSTGWCFPVSLISSEVKLGGLTFLSSFQDDAFGGLRLNLPGKKEFVLPEYWQGFHVSCFAADIWAAAVCLYVLVKGTNPFPIRHLDQHIEKMVNYSVIPELDGFSDDLLHLLQLCMSPKLTLRPTLDQILVPPRESVPSRPPAGSRNSGFSTIPRSTRGKTGQV